MLPFEKDIEKGEAVLFGRCAGLFLYQNIVAKNPLSNAPKSDAETAKNRLFALSFPGALASSEKTHDTLAIAYTKEYIEHFPVEDSARAYPWPAESQLAQDLKFCIPFTGKG
mgnify:CR=1 FL=1